MIQALVQKDILLFFRNRFFALLTALGLVVYAVTYLLMPSTAEQFPAALYVQNATASPMAGNLAAELEAKLFDSADGLKAAVSNGEYIVGVVLSADRLGALLRGDPVSVPVYYAPGITKEQRTAITDVIALTLDNINFSSGNLSVNLVEKREVLGADLSGVVTPIALRDRMLPTFLLLLLAVETMGLATLIVEEVETGTVQALLVTPLSTGRFFLGKAIMGIGLAFVQVLILVAVTGKITSSPLILLVTLLDGSLLITGIAFLIASLAKEMMSAIAWGLLALVVLTIPAITVVFPAIASDWIKVIPTYYLVDTLHRALNLNATWGTVWVNLLVLLVAGLVALGLGSFVLRRRFV